MRHSWDGFAGNAYICTVIKKKSMKLEDLKVGSYLWLSDIKNPECADYGPLFVKKITRKAVKFNISYDDMWHHPKPHYINRDEVRVVFTNYSGKEVESGWWADEWEKDACDFFERIILLKATNKEDAFEEFRVLRAEKDAKEVADYIQRAIYDPKMGQQYSMFTMNAMDRLTEDYEITNNEKVRELYEALHNVAKLAKNIFG